MLLSNGDNLNIIYEAIFAGPDSVQSEVNQSRNQYPPLELASPKLIYRGEIQVQKESRTGNVAMGGREWQEFGALTVLED